MAAHFLGDWALQSRDMAVRKSSEFEVLRDHLMIVSLFLLIASAPFVGIGTACLFTISNMYFHGVIDWFGWSFYKKKFAHLTIEEHFKNYWFYTTIAIDQFLHIAIIILIFL